MVFIAVADESSFTGAAKRLNRTVSVISYTVSRLEALLGVELFARISTKRPQLTAAGRAVLAEARVVAEAVDGLRASVSGLLQGLEAELDLAIDVMLPQKLVGQVLREFADAYPTVSLRLHVEALGGVAALVLGGQARIGISGPLPDGVENVERVRIGAVPMVPVAAAGHPLAHIPLVTPEEARRHVQLVLSDRSPLTEGRDFGVFSPKTWRVADLSAKHALLREGIGWGYMPHALIESDLAAEALSVLTMRDEPDGAYQLSGIWRRDKPPGPAAAWLLTRFEQLQIGMPSLSEGPRS
jgi:DNA-binding transcriptional LysR family regulator